jgi:hypothetical protein
VRRLFPYRHHRLGDPITLPLQHHLSLPFGDASLDCQGQLRRGVAAVPGIELHAQHHEANTALLKVALDAQ